jgi:SAM-dependent methyltransferase
MIKGFGPETFGALNAETYDRATDGPSAAETQLTVDVLAELAGGGAVLELAIGTGRVGLPLAQRGLAVEGIEGSPEMVSKLREKPGGEAIPVVIGDYAEVGVDGPFDLVILVFNTLFNLPAQADQVRCFRNVAGHLTDRGVFVIEAFVPPVGHYPDGQRTRTVHVGFDRVTVEASIHDPLTQTIHYQYVTIGPNGARLTPLPLRYAWPSEIDLMAELAGLELRNRWSDWRRAPFTSMSESHISVYGRRS